MSVGLRPLLLLDTCIVVHLARNDRTGQHVETTYQLTSRADRPLISTITEGEILGLAYRWRWGQQRLDALRDLLAEFIHVEAGLAHIVEAYARLYAEMVRQGRPTGKNDLWIAATAQATNAILMTADHDYDWMHPNLVQILHIPPIP